MLPPTLTLTLNDTKPMRLRSTLPLLSRFWHARVRYFQHGHRLADDLRRRRIRPRLVFDVGANTGQSALAFTAAFPGATIHTFEPFRDTFSALRQNTAAHSHIHAHCLALGAEAGVASVRLQGSGSVNNSLVSAKENSESNGSAEHVKVDTIDAFCARQGIGTIDFLKVDTEGYDLEVLKGTSGLLQAQRVDLLQVEAGMNPLNHKHVPLTAFLSFLEPLGYMLFGIYDQTPEWDGDVRLRFSNPVFISTRYMESLGRFPIRSAGHDERARFRFR